MRVPGARRAGHRRTGAGDGLVVRPVLLSKVLGLNEVQESSLGLVFYYADNNGLPLLDLKDLVALLKFLTSDDGKDELKEIGGVSAATAGVILRNLVTLSEQGWRRVLRRARV